VFGVSAVLAFGIWLLIRQKPDKGTSRTTPMNRGDR
jgi:hypothetical protein